MCREALLAGCLCLVLACCRGAAAVPVQPDAQRGGAESRAGEGVPASAPTVATAEMAVGCWRRGQRVREDELVQFRVALKQSAAGLERLEATVLAVSDPSSPQYGRHLSLTQVQDLVAPPPRAIETVKAWLQSAGISPRQMRASSNGDFVSGLVPARTLQRLLGVPLVRFHCGDENATAAMTIIRTERAPRLPAHVQELVDFVSPGPRLPAVGR